MLLHHDEEGIHTQGTARVGTSRRQGVVGVGIKRPGSKKIGVPITHQGARRRHGLVLLVADAAHKATKLLQLVVGTHGVGAVLETSHMQTIIRRGQDLELPDRFGAGSRGQSLAMTALDDLVRSRSVVGPGAAESDRRIRDEVHTSVDTPGVIDHDRVTPQARRDQILTIQDSAALNEVERDADLLALSIPRGDLDVQVGGSGIASVSDLAQQTALLDEIADIQVRAGVVLQVRDADVDIAVAIQHPQHHCVTPARVAVGVVCHRAIKLDDIAIGRSIDQHAVGHLTPRGGEIIGVLQQAAVVAGILTVLLDTLAHPHDLARLERQEDHRVLGQGAGREEQRTEEQVRRDEQRTQELAGHWFTSFGVLASWFVA
jgi:hypothetical protein